MKFKSLMTMVLAAVIFTGCSSPQRITLKDNTVIDTRDEVNFNKKTGFYEYEDIAGNSNTINKDVILKIEELK